MSVDDEHDEAAREAADGQLDLLAGVARQGSPDDEGLTSRSRWGTFERHDPVVAKGLRGEHVFWAHVTNRATGDEWITVYGGTKNGVRQFRSVEVESVTAKKPKGRRRRSASSAEPSAQASLDL